MEILMSHIPLLAPKHFTGFSPLEYREYIRTLRTDYLAEQAIKAETRKLKQASRKSPALIEGVSFRINAKGTRVLTIRRKPKQLTKAEINLLAKQHGIPQNEMWVLVRSKSIEVVK